MKDHGAEFIGDDRFSIVSNPPLLEQHRPRGTEFDGDGDGEHQGAGGRQNYRRQNHILQPFGRAARPNKGRIGEADHRTPFYPVHPMIGQPQA